MDTSFIRGRRIALDIGSVRIGVASCDPDGILATPVETITRAIKNNSGKKDSGLSDSQVVQRISELVDEHNAIAIVIGMPTTLQGKRGMAADSVTNFSQLLRGVTEVPIDFFDERLTTVTAHQALRASGRTAKNSRGVIDQVAAVGILQGWLDQQRAKRVVASD